MAESLYDIDREWLDVEEMLAVSDGEINPSIESKLNDVLARHRNKVDGYVEIMRKKELLAEAREKRASEIAALAKTDRNTSGRLKAMLMDSMVRHGIEKIETPNHKIYMQKNPSRPKPKVFATKEDIPDRFKKVEEVVTIDYTALQEALDAGDEEAMRVAISQQAGFHLRIK